MTPRARIDWPAQTPPDDFADRVVAAALGDRVAVAQDEPAALEPQARRWRVHAVWLVAAALGTMFAAGIVAHNKTQEAARQQALAAEQISVAAEENAKLKKQLEEAQQKVDALMDQLAVASTDVQRAELRRKIEEATGTQVAMKSRAAAAGGGGPPAAKTKPACKCQPGDVLCSCL